MVLSTEGTTVPESAKSQTPPYFRFVARFLRPRPDFDFGFIKPVRAEAVRRLGLAPGARVLDAGCGPGGSLPFLRAAVGETGECVGVEISPTVAALAERRIAQRGWSNVSVRVAPAQLVELPGSFDGLLMFAAPDVYASPEAVHHLLPRLRPGAGVAFFGAKLSSGRWGWLLNGPFRWLMPRLSFASTPVPTEAPWDLWRPHLEQLEVREFFFGWMFLASGRVRQVASA
ncbi:MAG: methyltransferase domain-containing protein [Gemmatimonadetes bacterium]|nr:methyltransferase domain-containing protein [Gemmatimonadota bacterium]